MPLRTFHKNLVKDSAERLLTAGPDDIEVHVRSTAFGASGASAGYSFLVGGPEVEHGGGLYCFSGEWASAVEEGDEIWAAAAEHMEFRESTPVTVLVRSRQAPKLSQRREDKPAAGRRDNAR